MSARDAVDVIRLALAALVLSALEELAVRVERWVDGA